jgi:hypothetical protein
VTYPPGTTILIPALCPAQLAAWLRERNGPGGAPAPKGCGPTPIADAWFAADARTPYIRLTGPDPKRARWVQGELW